MAAGDVPGVGHRLGAIRPTSGPGRGTLKGGLALSDPSRISDVEADS